MPFKARLNKRAGFDFQTYLIGTFLIMGIIVTFSGFYVDMAGKYGKTGTTEGQAFSDTYNQVDTLSSNVNTIQERMNTTSLGETSSQSVFWGDAASILKIIGNTLTLPITLVGEMIKQIPMPAVWQVIFPAILVVLVATLFLFMIFQNKGT